MCYKSSHSMTEAVICLEMYPQFVLHLWCSTVWSYASEHGFLWVSPLWDFVKFPESENVCFKEAVTFYRLSVKSSTWKFTTLSIPLFYILTEQEDVVIGKVRFCFLSCQIAQKSPYFKVAPQGESFRLRSIITDCSWPTTICILLFFP